MHVHLDHIHSSQEVPVGPVEVGRHHQYQENAREESDMGATLRQVSFIHILKLCKPLLQEMQHMDDLHSEFIELSQGNGYSRAVIEV